MNVLKHFYKEIYSVCQYLTASFEILCLEVIQLAIQQPVRDLHCLQVVPLH